MEREIDTIIHIAIELMLCALLISAIACCAILGNKMLAHKLYDDGNEAYMQDIADLYYYNNKVVTGSDILELMLTYTRDYSYWINYYDASGNVVDSIEISKSKESLTGDYREYWSEKSLREFMNGHEKTKYTANIVRYSGGNGVAGVQFDCKEG